MMLIIDSQLAEFYGRNSDMLIFRNSLEINMPFSGDALALAKAGQKRQ